jgi:hypothetical protein
VKCDVYGSSCGWLYTVSVVSVCAMTSTTTETSTCEIGRDQREFEAHKPSNPMSTRKPEEERANHEDSLGAHLPWAAGQVWSRRGELLLLHEHLVVMLLLRGEPERGGVRSSRRPLLTSGCRKQQGRVSWIPSRRWIGEGDAATICGGDAAARSI